MEKRIKKNFEETYEQHADGVFRFCYFKIHDRERARELMQESFMKTWEMLRKDKSIDNLKAYVYRSAHNLVVNEITRKRDHYSLETLGEETGFEPKSLLPLPDAESEIRILIQSIERLGKPYTEILLLRFVSDLSVKEIAVTLKESENVISVRIHRAVGKLKLIHKS